MTRIGQTPLELRTHGGRRKGAGRKPKGDRAMVSHKERPRFDQPMPAHVTLQVLDGVPSLRSSHRFAVIRRGLAAMRGRGVKLVEFTVTEHHLQLIVEAESSETLSRVMQGLCIRLAKGLNKSLNRRGGTIFADHYHLHLLGTRAEVRNALDYVAGNAGHHSSAAGPDSCSSRNPELRDLVELPETLLLRLV